MTPNGPNTPGAPPILRRARWRGWRFLAIALLIALPAGWWFWGRHNTPPPPDPPSPVADDAEIEAVLRTARERVVNAPGSAEAWGEYGFVLLAHQFEQDASRCLEEAARLDPNDPRWPYTLARIAITRDVANSPRYLRQALAVNRGGPYREEALVALGDVLLEQGKADEAADAYREVMAAHPGEPRAEFGLGQLALARGDTTAARDHLNRATAGERCRKQAHALLAQLARADGDEAAATKHERIAANLSTPPPWMDSLAEHIMSLQVGYQARLRQAQTLEAEGRNAEAAALFSRMLARDRSARNLIGAGFNLAIGGDPDRGLELMREGVAKDPNDARSRAKLAAALFALAELEVHRSPGSSRIRPWFEEAVQHARRAADAQPENGSAFLYWGVSLKYLGDTKGAIEPLRRGLIARPDEFELHLALGEVLAATQDRAGAEAEFKTAHDLDPADPRPARELEKLKGK